MKGLSERSVDRLLAAASDGKFTTLADFFHRMRPSGEELEAMIRAWQTAMDELTKTKGDSTRHRHETAMKDKAFDLIPATLARSAHA